MTETDAREEAAEGAPPGPGSRLREAREARSLAVMDVAVQLNLDAWIIEALEADDHARLPAPIFVRGYLRSYAKLVGLPPEALLADYRPPASEPPGGRAPDLSRRPSLRLPRIPWKMLFRLLLLALFVGLGIVYGPRLWERFGAVDEEAPASGRLPLPPSKTLPVPAPAPESAPSRVLPLPPPATTALADGDKAGAPPAADEAGAAADSAVAPPAAVPAVADGPLDIEMTLVADSWVEVRDARGRRPVYGLLRKGSTRRFRAVPPVAVKLGNPPAVRLKLDGEPYDLSGYNPGSVARFTLNRQR
ncbi:DUF4115 domain-containing protein [Thiohalobacter sp. IOR34]|uniref:helix-turn-helix domain-containing protein n=1 Tax=Thiohalobacter sp. IOR34 TaxID=3057176 RepID=UPI0025B1A842|nr:helix-turn-helix domain-containing protein [Thiohalobacter sp. IOR34]WJW76265.1 DUF4115 domain-containing protein [Thiohalobacter sp. IOR34]